MITNISSNQPLDSDTFSAIVNELNKARTDIDALTSKAYNNKISTNAVSSTKTLFHAGFVTFANPSSNSLSVMTMDYSFDNIPFKNTPIVVATINGTMASATPALPIITVTSVSISGCKINMYFTSGTKPSTDILVNVLAIGENNSV